MAGRILPLLSAALLLAASCEAMAARFTEGPCGPALATQQDGFVETPGPNAYAPEHAGDFKPPGPADTCPPANGGSPPQQSAGRTTQH